jgi:hypothetical protein
MSRSKSQKEQKKQQERLRLLWERYVRQLEELLSSGALLRGSFCRVHTRCGKANCWCAKSPQGHRHTRLTWSEQGQMMTRSVPAEAIDQVVELTSNYRKFRRNRRKLLVLADRMEEQLEGFEQGLLRQGIELLTKLGFSAEMSPRKQNRRPKGLSAVNKTK